MIEVEPVPPFPEAADTPELRMQDLMTYGVLITRDGKRIDPLEFYSEAPKSALTAQSQRPPYQG